MVGHQVVGWNHIPEWNLLVLKEIESISRLGKHVCPGSVILCSEIILWHAFPSVVILDTTATYRATQNVRSKRSVSKWGISTDQSVSTKEG